MTRLRVEAEGLPSEIDLGDPSPRVLKLDPRMSRLVAFVVGLDVQSKIPEFGSVTLHFQNTEVASWEIKETGRVAPPKPGRSAVLKLWEWDRNSYGDRVPVASAQMAPANGRAGHANGYAGRAGRMPYVEGA